LADRSVKDTVIVLLPGLDGTGTLFRPLREYVPSHLRPVVVAYPGDEKLGYQALLPRVMQSLPTEEPFIILGESFSGPLALMAAATCPPGLQAVILCATFVRNPFWIRAAWLRYLVPDFAFGLYPIFSGAKAMFGGYSTPELRAALQSAVATVAPGVLAHRVREVLQADVSEELSRCPVPILYLRGSRDLVVPKHNFKEIAGLSVYVSEAVIAAPHMVLQTRPREALAAIARFIEQWIPPNRCTSAR
jgi:pimeloyl-ACP methyl ester carboxylesterase